MILIPARLASTRFPNKILCDIHGLPMVIKTAKNASNIDDVCVACDDNSVLELCKSHKIKAVLTSKEHNSGTDRCNEAAKILGLNNNEIIINIQADEPFLESSVLSSLQEVMKSGAWMGSCAKVITYEQASDPNLVKVIMDIESNAIYFSRSIIPYNRDNVKTQYFGHLGVYGYSVKSLREFCEFKESSLENIEKLEQLRAIYNAKKIKMCVVETKSVGIDTKEDLKRALELFKH